jgi:FecR protein/Putative zinc-finger
MQEHITEKLSAYLNHELPKDERQRVSEHLLQCEQCRNEHDEIKFGAALASQLQRSDAPNVVWNEIENALEGKPKAAAVSYFSIFKWRALPAALAILLIGFGVIYFGFLRKQATEIVVNTPTENQNSNVVIPQIIPTPEEISTNQNTNTNVTPQIQTTPKTNSNVQALPKINPAPSPDKPNETLVVRNNNLPSWNVETITGAPKAGNQTIGEKGKLSVGEFLETDANSSARVQVANIGQVEIKPNSRVRLVKTASTEHRLSLEKGLMQAKISAPPRLFIVDTPSAVAVDLGCEYTLEVDEDGNTKLHVTLGYVALERDGRESIVPAGAICYTRRGKGLGTPFSEDSSAEFQAALVNFDFQNGGSGALQTIIGESNLYDTVTLWHLLARVPKNEQGKVFDALAAQVPPPFGVTREGILRLDKKMLDRWWTEIENLWFE